MAKNKKCLPLAANSFEILKKEGGIVF